MSVVLGQLKPGGGYPEFFKTHFHLIEFNPTGKMCLFFVGSLILDLYIFLKFNYEIEYVSPITKELYDCHKDTAT